MVALVATIHAFFRQPRDAATPKKPWMVGLKPTMTTLCGRSGGAHPPPLRTARP
jgi:hypothetical protein